MVVVWPQFKAGDAVKVGTELQLASEREATLVVSLMDWNWVSTTDRPTTLPADAWDGSSCWGWGWMGRT